MLFSLFTVDGALSGGDATTTATTVLAIATPLLLACFQYYRQRKFDTEKDFIPMAPVGFFHSLKKLGGPEAPWFVWELAKEQLQQQQQQIIDKERSNVPSFMFRLPIPVGIGGLHIIGDAGLVRQIYMDPKTEKPDKVYKAFRSSSGVPTLFSSGTNTYTKTIRKSVAHAFSKTEIDRMNTIAMKHVDAWMTGRLQDFVKSGTTFDPGHELIRITFFVINEAAFEYQATDQEFEDFTYHSEIALREFGVKQMGNPIRKYFGRYFLPDVRKALESAKEGRAFAKKVIDAYRSKNNDTTASKDKSDSTTTSTTTTSQQQNTLIRILNDATVFDSEYQRVVEVLSWIFAGQDTTGYTIGNALTLLAKHPDEQDAVRKALVSNPDVDPKDVPYFRNVIQEVKRLFPVGAMGSIREAGRDFKVPTGGEGGDSSDRIIPKGAVCMLNQFLYGRNPNLFEEPEVFRPQRWDTASKAMEDAVNMYFALGSRNCPGQYLATAEINSLLPRILKQYSLELVDEGGFDYFITLKYVGSKVRANKLE